MGKKAAHHGGAWKVAYADFVTAMMALFIVLWIIKDRPEMAENIAASFRKPLVGFKGGEIKEEVKDPGVDQENLTNKEQVDRCSESRQRCRKSFRRMIQKRLRWRFRSQGMG